VGRRSDEGEETSIDSGEAILCKQMSPKEADVKAMVDKAVGVFGRLDIALIMRNCRRKSPLIEQTEYDRTMNVNVKGVSCR